MPIARKPARGLLVLALGAVGIPAGSAIAQEAEGEWRLDTRLTLAMSTLDETPGEAPAADGFAADAGLVVSRRDFLENGLALDWRGEFRLRRDTLGRPSFAGGFGSCAGGPGCGAVAPGNGLFVGGGLVETGAELFVEGASLSVSGPWGEGVAGLDAGVAARLDARAPQVLDGVSAFSPMLDPSGGVIVRARNDVTGPSAKVSYMTPRWLGFRGGVSFTPEANLAGADFDPDPAGSGLAGAELENVFEGALSFSRRFRSNGVLVRAALTGVSASSGSKTGGYEDYSAFGAGLELERDGWSAGLRWLDSNNARDGDQSYQAVEVGLARDAGPWRFGVEWGSASDEFLDLEGQSWLVGMKREIGDKLSLGVAYQAVSDKYPSITAPYGYGRLNDGGVVVEMSVRN